MTIAAIDATLKNWNYARALALYRAYDPDPFLLKLFEAGPDSFNERKLRSLLKSLIENTFNEAGKRASVAGENYKSLIEDTVHLPAKASLTGNLAKPDYPAVKPSDGRPLVDYHNAPQEVKLIISERIAAFNRAKLLFENLWEDGDPEEEKQKALEILKLRTLVDEYWDKLNYYAQHKVLPPEVEDPHAGWSEGQLKDKQRNLRTYITHAKAGRRNADKLEEWELELQMIERRLANGDF